MKLEITIPDSALEDLVTKDPTIYCPGGSLQSKRVPAIVQVEQFPDPNSYNEGQSLVICSRLKGFYNHRVITLCYEGPPEEFDRNNREQLENSHPCPFYRPAKKSR